MSINHMVFGYFSPDFFPENIPLISIIFFTLCLLLLTGILAAYTLMLRIKNIRVAVRRSEQEQRWQPVILQILEGKIPPEKIKEYVRKNEEKEIVRYLMIFASRIKGVTADKIKNAASYFLPFFLAELDSPIPETRAIAMKVIASFGLDSYEDRIYAGLEDRSPLVAMIAARALARSRDPRHVKKILEKLHIFDGWSREFLVSMLVSTGPQMLPDLRTMLKNSEIAPELRAIIADALREMNDTEASQIASNILEEILDNKIPRSSELAAACLRLISKTGHMEKTEVAEKMCAVPEGFVRAAALDLLGQFGGDEGYPCLMKGLLEDESPWVALHAARAILKAGGRKILEAMALSGHPRKELAKQVLEETEPA